ncbi:unnamed protein product [Rhodiola kirilowii]
MAKSMIRAKKLAYISVPSQIINSLSSSSLQSLLLTSPKKSIPARSRSSFSTVCLFLVFLLFFFGFIATGIFKLGLGGIDRLHNPCLIATQQSLQPASSESDVAAVKASSGTLPIEVGRGGGDESEFWKQPDGLGYMPCLRFTEEYSKESAVVLKDRTKYLLVVVSGGLNQQRNQIVDAVVIARILGAALVVPILQVNVIWGDESEFGDIFDLEHFRRTLADDVRIVSSLPSTHLMYRPLEEKQIPLHSSPRYIRARYYKRLKREGALLLRGLDSRLTTDLPSDLQKLRCKVAFHALRFAPPILALGNKLAERMRSKGPYLALHLRMEKDVWVRTGCLPGLSREYDEVVNKERELRPELLTGRSNMTYHERKLAGLCPLNAMEVTRLLKALGAPTSAKIYWAGGQPLGGKEALLPLVKEFPHLYNKEDLALPGELEPYTSRASIMAAIDYIVAENSDIFMPSHGGNMGHALQGQRAYSGHRKHITPNKRQMIRYFLNASLPEAEFNRIVKDLHRESLGQPDLKAGKAGRDVTKYPVVECMCNGSKISPTL